MAYITQIQDFIVRVKQIRRLLDNYSVPLETKMERAAEFLQKEAIPFMSEEHKVLDKEKEHEFGLLADDIVVQAVSFLQSKNRNTLDDAIQLIILIISVEEYILAVEKVPWKIGKKVSWLEKKRIQNIFRTELRNLYDPGTRKAVRGTNVKIILSGSLARGASDYKFIYNSGGMDALPKPSDYKLPRRYWAIIDPELNVAQEIKEKMSDVDILIMNEIIFDSMDPTIRMTEYSYKVGEKYNVPLTPLLRRIHQALESTKIGGIRGRWVNYVIVRNEAGYERYMASREKTIHGIEEVTGKVVVCHDVVILDEVVSAAPF